MKSNHPIDLFSGIWGSIQIPINRDDTIDFKSLEIEIELLANSSIRGLYSNGTAGEFYNQTETEFDKITLLMAEICKKQKKPYQIGASHMSPIISLERIKRTKSLNPVAYQVIFPDWVPTNQQEQIDFLTRIIEEADPIPIILYHPGHAKTTLMPSELKEIAARFHQLKGFKLGFSNAQWYGEMKNLPDNVSVFVPGHKLATYINAGVAKGSFSNMACLNPNAAQEWYEIIMKDIQAGLEIEKRINTFFEQCIIPLSKAGYPDPALDKFLWSLNERRSTGTKLRWPYKGVDEMHVKKTKTIGMNVIPEFFNNVYS